VASDSRADIEALIPHRPPFLFVDRVVEREGDAIVTEWDVPEDLDCFRGHFPGKAVLPGVLICEFVFQTGALAIHSSEDERGAGLPVLTRIEDARFKKLVRPGERLRAAVEIVERLANARYLSAKVTSDGATVLRMRCVLAHTVVERSG